METEQFLGIFGMFRESFSILPAWRRYFAQITVSLILPLAVVFLYHIDISDRIFSMIIHGEEAIDQTHPCTPSYNKTSDLLSKEWATFLLFKPLYLLLLLVHSLLFIAAVVYAITCVYTSSDLTLPNVMSVVPSHVPRVWLRLMFTFLFIFAATYIFFVHIVVSDLLLSIIIHGPCTLSYLKTSDLFPKECSAFLLFKPLYLLLLLVHSLLFIAAVVYAIARVYTGRDLTFPKVVSVVPRVRRRLMPTFLCIFAAAFVYNFIAALVFMMWAISVRDYAFGSFVMFLLWVF